MAFDEMVTLLTAGGIMSAILIIALVLGFLFWGSTFTGFLITLFNYLVSAILIPIKMFGAVLGKADKQLQKTNAKMKQKFKMV